MKQLIPEYIRSRIADMRARGAYSGYPNEHHCIFIHIPKAAGTSVTRTLFGCGSRHVRYTEYEMANPRKFAEYFKFSFVRNPWDRLYSAYSFLRQGGMGGQDKVWADEHLATYPDFDSFVKGWVTPENIRSWVHFYPQHYFICDDALNLKMDFIGRFEQMNRDVSVVQRQLGLPIQPLGKINVTNKKKHAPSVYTPETRDIVSRVYARDIELFHYDFDQELM